MPAKPDLMLGTRPATQIDVEPHEAAVRRQHIINPQIVGRAVIEVGSVESRRIFVGIVDRVLAQRRLCLAQARGNQRLSTRG